MTTRLAQAAATATAAVTAPRLKLASSRVRTFATTTSDSNSTTANTNPELYDVVIVGGGIAGSALACALASSKISGTQRIALIEASDLSGHIDHWHPVADQFSNRVSSLTPKSVAFLQQIGVWSELDSTRVTPVDAMQVWDGVSGARISFDAKDAENDSILSSILSLSGSRKGTSDFKEGASFRDVMARQQTLADAGVTTASSSSSSTSTGARKPHSPLAWMTENLHVQYGLQKQLLGWKAKGLEIDIFEKTKVQGISVAKPSEQSATGDLSPLGSPVDWPVIQLDNGKSLSARLLVGADGVNSPVRSFAKIESLGWDYEKFGLVATLQIDTDSKTGNHSTSTTTAWQRFLPTGPIALLPLQNGMASLVWSTTPKIAQDLKKLPEKDFVALVNAAFEATPAELDYLYKNIGADGVPLVDFEKDIDWRSRVRAQEHPAGERSVISNFVPVDETPVLPPKITGVQHNTRAPFPLKLRNSNSYAEDRVVLVGDAAHTVHPLAGQGLNQGLADVECLSRVIEESLLAGSDIGNIHALIPYSKERFLPNLAMLGTVDKLSKLYSTDFGPVVWARSVGLKAVDSMGPLKTEIMRFAMGLEEPLK